LLSAHEIALRQAEARRRSEADIAPAERASAVEVTDGISNGAVTVGSSTSSEPAAAESGRRNRKKLKKNRKAAQERDGASVTGDEKPPDAR